MTFKTDIDIVYYTPLQELLAVFERHGSPAMTSYRADGPGGGNPNIVLEFKTEADMMGFMAEHNNGELDVMSIVNVGGSEAVRFVIRHNVHGTYHHGLDGLVDDPRNADQFVTEAAANLRITAWSLEDVKPIAINAEFLGSAIDAEDPTSSIGDRIEEVQRVLEGTDPPNPEGEVMAFISNRLQELTIDLTHLIDTWCEKGSRSAACAQELKELLTTKE